MIWAGDSRIYRIREGEIRQLTNDHSHVAELVSQGHISEEEAELHPHANAITRAVGAHDVLMLDSLTMEALAGDHYVLCSDGLTAVMNRADIKSGRNGKTQTVRVRRWWKKAVERSTPDNVTAVVVSA